MLKMEPQEAIPNLQEREMKSRKTHELQFMLTWFLSSLMFLMYFMLMLIKNR